MKISQPTFSQGASSVQGLESTPLEVRSKTLPYRVNRLGLTCITVIKGFKE